MVRKLMMAAALAGAAILVLPVAGSYAGGMDEMSSQGGTLGTGAARTGTGPGTNAGDPNLSSKTGPGANPIGGGTNMQKPMRTKRHMTSHRRHRTTTGSSKY